MLDLKNLKLTNIKIINLCNSFLLKRNANEACRMEGSKYDEPTDTREREREYRQMQTKWKVCCTTIQIIVTASTNILDACMVSIERSCFGFFPLLVPSKDAASRL